MRRLLSLILVLSHGVLALAKESAPAAQRPTVLDPVIVTGALDESRDLLLPSLGASSFVISSDQIDGQSQGEDAPFNQVLLRAPGVAEDSAANGDLHVRGEHANLQYRINGVLLPEGISGFGLELDPRFVESLQLITGSLPAEYGFRTAGVVDITAKGGSFEPGGDLSLYGGSYGTFRPSFEASGTSGNLSGFVDASFDHNELGIENPTPAPTAIHDSTDQAKAFADVSWILDSTSRVSFMGGLSVSSYQVPDVPGVPAGNPPTPGNPTAVPWTTRIGITGFDSSDLDENQDERNYFGVVTYQLSAGELNLQASAFARESGVHFTPDPVGDLYFNGVASDVDKTLDSAGVQIDASSPLGDGHTIRAGLLLQDESVNAHSTTAVFPVDSDGNPTGPAFPIVDRGTLHGLMDGLYLQDEWRVFPELTVNAGARLDAFDFSFDKEHQLSPRINLLLRPSASTALHAGYSRYFTPPPVENVSGSAVAEFQGTSNQSEVAQDSPVRAERANYFDAGISQQIGTHFRMGVDAYTKQAREQLDDGLFGQTLILSAFNYAKGQVSGQEFTASWAGEGLSAYGNLAHSKALGENWDSAQFLFDPADLAYVRNHWINLDHDQTFTSSSGVAYRRKDGSASTLVYADVIFASGLRTDSTAPDGSNTPNGGSVPSYITLNVGAERSYALAKGRSWKVRVDVINLADKSYELRNGTGVGVNAAQYGMRRGFFGSVGTRF